MNIYVALLKACSSTWLNIDYIAEEWTSDIHDALERTCDKAKEELNNLGICTSIEEIYRYVCQYYLLRNSNLKSNNEHYSAKNLVNDCDVKKIIDYFSGVFVNE